MDEDDTGPLRAFEGSRRLTGANRYYPVPAVVLEPLGPASLDGAAHGRWVALVVDMARALGWPDPMPRVHAHGEGIEAGIYLAFAAPPDRLLTATEVNEWAWESASAGHPLQVHAGFVPAYDLGEASVAHFRTRAQGEAAAPLRRLEAAADDHDVPVLLDDEQVTLGEGAGSVTYPRAWLPLPMDVPWQRLHAVPKVLVTGSNGKTTTARLLAAMAAEAGLVPGLCSTEGVQVGAQTVETGDYAGPAGARVVLRHPAVTAAVLETARGGLLRRGLAVRRADLAIVTNVSADHFGEYGVHSVEDIAEAKLVCAHALAGGGTLLLCGDDAALLRVALALPHSAAASWALFGRDHDAPLLDALRRHGGQTCAMREGRLVLHLQGEEQDLGAVADMPLTLGGAAAYNVDNLAAAALAAALLQWPLEAVRRVLGRFGASPSDNPGRLERWTHRGATVLIDYAHNPEGLAALMKVAAAMGAGRIGLLLGQAGNRGDEAIAELAATAASFRPDRVVIKELPAMLRGREVGVVPMLLEQGLRTGGLPARALRHEHDEEAAARALMAWAKPGDVVVLPVHTPEVRARLAAFLSVA
jgi:UDP-N-acetylmuramyl tripeptide synthase